MPQDEVVNSMPKSKENESRWSYVRKKIREVCSSHAMEWLLFIFLLADVLFVIVQLSLEATRECVAEVDEHTGETKLVYEFTSHTIHEVAEALHIASIAIISIFMLHILFTIVGMGIEFFKKPLLIIDMVIVAASLILDILVSASIASIFVLTRIWRLMRIVHGIFASVHEQEHKRTSKVENLVERMTVEVERMTSEREELQKEIAHLKQRLQRYQDIYGPLTSSRRHSEGGQNNNERHSAQKRRSDSSSEQGNVIADTSTS